MKKLFVIPFLLVLILVVISMSGCMRTDLRKVDITAVDDESGLAYGTLEESHSGAESATFNIAVPYQCLHYNKEENAYYLNMNRYQSIKTPNKYIKLAKYSLKGKVTDKKAGEIAEALLLP